MSTKLEKYAAEREKARRKRDEWDARMKEWDAKYREQENTEIHEMVHAANLSPEQLAALLAAAQHTIPDTTELTMEPKEDSENEN